ncbi:hypothetical protein FGO68_gene12147 [Halteria grandinella]|uniref:Uncharacterized protein n=1 Tax=Halteria grandinella TaxID=5974 RepID=A0A8J8T4C6_HALGN|nr:hypothetical protein FGO68_gene12147 [Halteria grandinella]
MLHVFVFKYNYGHFLLPMQRSSPIRPKSYQRISESLWTLEISSDLRLDIHQCYFSLTESFQTLAKIPCSITIYLQIPLHSYCKDPPILYKPFRELQSLNLIQLFAVSLIHPFLSLQFSPQSIIQLHLQQVTLLELILSIDIFFMHSRPSYVRVSILY